MLSVHMASFWAVLVPGLCQGAYAQTTCVLDIKGAIGFLALLLLREARLYRFLIPFAAFRPPRLSDDRLDGRDDCER